MFPPEPVPDRIGAYEIVKRVGRVGAADVYSARMQGPLDFSREVTLKLVRLDDDVRTAEELGREATICARLNHPVVVRMYDFFEWDRRLVLVLEQVEGASLDRLLSHLRRRKQTLSDHSVFFIAAQIASALAHAHAATDESGTVCPIIHRDLKPENVMIGWDGTVRLAGFGLGKILGRSPDSVAGTVRGTPGFMAPEQARGERATVRSDVYSLGVLIWSVLTGREAPLDGARCAPLAELRPDLPRELHAAIDAALEPLPDKRRITCGDLTQWLVKLAKIETGREELRQKVLWLRSSRGPAGKLDASSKPVRAPNRRQALQASRPTVRRLSSRPPSAWPKSGRPRTSTSAPPPSARPVSVREGSGLLRIPPPPHLPDDTSTGTESSRPSERVEAKGSNGEGHTGLTSVIPRPRTRTTTSPPSSNRDEPVASPRVHVRTVSAPPPPRSTAPSTRRTGAPPDASLAGFDPNWSVGVTMPRVPSFGPLPTGDVGDADGELPGFIPLELRHAELIPPGQRSLSPTAGPASTSPRSLSQSPANGDAVTARPPAPNTFPLAMQIILATLTAALVVTLGLLLLRKESQPQPPQVVTVEVARAQEPLPTPTPEPAPSPAPNPPPTAETARPGFGMPDPSGLGENLGYVEVKGPSSMDVYLNGVRRGPTNETLAVPCGHFFMRLAAGSSDPPKYPAWHGPGQSVYVACRSATVLTAKLPPT
jgi:eukaryotic-like serine/threonine-protein kinase